jgi:hypothetical protein
MKKALAFVFATMLLASIAAAAIPPGQKGYEGQPGNQGGSNGTSNGQKGYEGQPGHQGGH